MTPDEARDAIELWTQVQRLPDHPGWKHVAQVLVNDRRSALEVLASVKVKDPFDIGRARGVLEECNSIEGLLARAQREIDALNQELEQE